jgi:hypothetical protein
VTDRLIGRKRQINDVIREPLDHFREDEPIALVPGHLATEDRADAVVSSTTAALTHERNVRITGEASD